MSDSCATCDCADKSQCTKKGYTAEIIETNNSYVETTTAMDVAEHDGKCKCGSNCTCTNCKCGH